MRLLTYLPFVLFFLLAAFQRTSAQTTSSGQDTTTFVKVEYESHFPGGQSAWMAFLQAHFSYPNKAVKKKIEGTVIVQFIVGKDGTITDIQAISGPDLLRPAAEKIIRQSPPWTPAFQDGRPVKSYKKQPFVFKLED